MKELIASLQNPKIKNLRKLREKSSERQKQQLFVIEGLREITLAQEAGIPFRTVFYCRPVAGPDVLNTFDRKLLLEVSPEVFGKIAYRENSDGLIALAEYRPLGLGDLKLSANPFLIILEAVEKPGNLGAVLRTADAARADGVIVCDPRTDICNPNVIRSSLGSVFTTPVLAASTEETLDYLGEKGIKSYAAALTAERYYHETDLKGPCAVVMGAESSGLSRKWLEGATAQIKIPMRGKIDSLNVSASCAIIVFEAMRQRNFL
ncbi:MAG TPA: RNA methyltransferase [Anseongella sp.]|nr:RNA methyltransferase [Anseongella sp.]